MTILNDARVLLAELARSPYADIHVRTAAGEMFLAKPHGGANPMRASDDRPRVTITAPHVATVISLAAPGSAMAAGAVVARLAVLDETIEVASEDAGFVAEVLASAGDLVDFDAPLLTISA